MASKILLLLAAIAFPLLHAQDPANSLPSLPKDPRDMLTAAAPLYDFENASLSPWHLKGSYQLFDENGNPGEQGTYEYWWVAPKVFRSSWKRPGAMLTEWHTADDRTFSQSSGDRLFFLEFGIPDFLFSPIPDPTKVDPKYEIGRDQIEAGKQKFPCARVSLRKYAHQEWMLPGTGPGVYCFDSANPVLRVERFSSSVYVQFSNLSLFEKRLLARKIIIVTGRQNLLEFTVDSVGPIAKDDPAVMPPPDALQSASIALNLSPSGAQDKLLKKQTPTYPYAAKRDRISGVVLLDTIIGTNGTIKDVRVLSSPSQLLTEASVACVKQWQYTPYLKDGQPREVGSMISVIFSISR